MGAEEDESPFIVPTAYRHGVAAHDIEHALRHMMHNVQQDDGVTMIIGPDTVGALIEVGVVEWRGEAAVIHAMRPARAKYLR